MNCSKCSKQTPENANYCPYCGTLLKCKSCGTEVLSESLACYNCGEKFSETNTSSHNANIPVNSITYKENSKERTFDARFTDALGESMTNAFGNVMANKFGLLSGNQKFNKTHKEDEDDIETEFEDLTRIPEKSLLSESDDATRIKKLFDTSNEGWVLSETRLKAKNKTEWACNLVLLYTYGKIVVSSTPPLRNELSKLLSDFNANEGGVRGFISNKSIFHINPEKQVTLTKKGEEDAISILNKVFDANIENIFDIGTKSKNKGSENKRAYETIDIGLGEKEREDIRVFYNQKSPQKQDEEILVLIFWMSNYTQTTVFDSNIVYSLFQIVNEEPPKDIAGLMSKLKSSGKLLGGEKKGKYTLHSNGSDFVKFKLPNNKNEGK